jgi:hypothetical protein
MDYMIAGTPKGLIRTAERITASAVLIPLDFTHGKLDAAVHLRGVAVDGQQHGVLSADLTLTRTR